MLQGLIGKKDHQSQGFLQDGTRVPLSVVSVLGNSISQIKTQDKEGYNALQIAFQIKKKQNKAITGHSKKAGLKNLPRFFREIRVDEVSDLQLGSEINPSDIFKPGDIVDVTGVSKGKGFAGVVKRHNFKGGPRTHGQSDRERAPGSIGQTTTPGHVYRGKRMAGRMGQDKVTVKNLEIIDITNDGALLIKGLIPGSVNSLVVVKKVGENKKFVPLYNSENSEQLSEPVKSDKSEVSENQKEEVQAPADQVQEDVKIVEEPKEEVKEENANQS